MVDECVFCKIVKEEIPAKIIEETENFIAIPDANPKVEGHTLIISKKHFANILELPSVLGDELIGLIKKVALGFKSDFNVVANTGSDSGQVIFHFHLHILPRKKGDGLHSLA